MTRDEAWALFSTWTETPSLVRHGLAVEHVMRRAAERYGGDVETFGIAGLLHDADYDAWPEDHPDRIVAWLRERGEEDLAYAISAHYTKWGREHRTTLDKALLACDELTGFVMACALIRPTGIHGLSWKSVRKKLKTERFAAGVERHEVRTGAELLGVELADHTTFVIEALTEKAAELGLEGTG